MTLNVRVVKLGGSLLGGPELAESVSRWLTMQTPAVHVVVVGGGTLVDQLRQLDRAAAFKPETAHWLAVRAMGLTAGLVARMLDGWRLVESIDALDFDGAPPPQVLDVERFLRALDRGPDPLPATWDVTSDSIAARLAVELGAGELVLLKSASPPAPAACEQWARAGYVDRYFPCAAAGLRVRAVNLRSPGFEEVAVDSRISIDVRPPGKR